MADDPQDGEQRVLWAELLFDLVWVFAITQIATALANAHGAGDAARSLLLFVPLWWSWVGTTLLANLAGPARDRALGRIVLFAVAGLGLMISVAVPGAYGDRGLLFGVVYAVLRLVLWLAMRQVTRAGGSPPLGPYTTNAFVAAPLFLLGGVLDGPARVAAWAAAAVVELAGPRLFRGRVRNLRFEAAHLPERFGLFLIIALGETVVAIGGQASSNALDAPGLVALALAFTLTVLLWWTYFHFGASAVRYSLQTSSMQTRIVTEIFSYAHLGYVVAIILIAVGMKKLLAHPLDVPHSLPELLLAPGAAVYLFVFCYSRWRMFGAAGLQRFVAALIACALALAAPLLPAIATAALVTALLLALNIFEAWRVNTGRPILLLHLPRPIRREPAATEIEAGT